MSEFDKVRERRMQFLRAAYDLGKSRPANMVNMEEIAQQMGVEWNVLERGELDEYANYYGGKGFIRRQADGYGILSITPKGIDEVEGNNQPQQSNVSNIFNISGPVQGSVIGTHNTAELTNHFDFRSIEQRIEHEGGEDKEELREALNEVRQLLESGKKLDRGAWARFSGVMQRNNWFASPVMTALVGFATQTIS